MIDCLTLSKQICLKAQRKTTLKRNARNKIYSYNSMNASICLMTDQITDDKYLKIVRPHRYRIVRLMNTSPVHNAQRIVRAYCLSMQCSFITHMSCGLNTQHTAPMTLFSKRRISNVKTSNMCDASKSHESYDDI